MSAGMIKTYVLNMDRHVERLERMRKQLDAQGIIWERFAAIDAVEVDHAYLDVLVAPKGPIPRMGTGARACTAGHILMLRDFVESEATHALILEDDAELAPSLAADLPKIIKAVPTGVLNINRQASSGSDKKIIVRAAPTASPEGYDIHDLIGIHYGTAGYVIDKSAAKAVLETYPRPDMPIDFVLFNPNLSTLFSEVPIRQIFPALVRPEAEMVSSIQHEPVHASNSFPNKIKRAKAELSIVPRVLVGLLFKRYAVKILKF